MEPATIKNLPTIQADFLLVNLNGPVAFNVDGILAAIQSKKLFEYDNLHPRHYTMLDSKTYMYSFLYHSLDAMIQHSTDLGAGWFSGEWQQQFGTEISNQRVDILFYAEFVFLVAEDLVRFDDYLSLTDADIWRNVGVDITATPANNKTLQPMYKAKDLETLKTTYKKLVKEYHPDKTGSDNDVIKLVTAAFLVLKKQFKNKN